MHQDDVRDSDSSPCDQRLTSASAWRAFNVLKYSHLKDSLSPPDAENNRLFEVGFENAKND